MINPFRSRPFTKRKCVGVVGLLQAGKTVLMTSLIDHLKNHDPRRIPIGRNGTQVVPINAKIRPSTRWAPFNFDLYRNGLTENEWPKKTLVPEEFRAIFCRDDWRWTLIDLSLLDIPGERMADLTIAAYPRFADWSDEVVGMLRRCPEFRDAAQPFLQFVDAPENANADPERLLMAYRRTLARLVCDYMPVVTPSSFLIDTKDCYVAEDILELPHGTSKETDDFEEELARRQYSGLSSEEQFAPLPSEVRRSNPEIEQQFARSYAKYRKQVVMPFASELQACNELLVLIDIASVLESGVGFLNAYREILDRTLRYIRPGFTPAGIIAKSLRWAATLGLAPLSHVQRVTFVATMADRVHARDRVKLEGLMRQLAMPLIKPFKAIRNVRDEYLTCAALEATYSESADDESVDDRFICFKQRDSARMEYKTVKLEASAVPETWPDSWKVGNYRFPRPVAWMPEARTNPPPQFGLHRIAELILS